MPLDIARCRTTDALVAQLAAGRDLTATWLVVDMDAFFASVEELHDPSLVRTFRFKISNQYSFALKSDGARKHGTAPTRRPAGVLRFFEGDT